FWFATPLWPTSVDYLQHHPLMLLKLLSLWLLWGSHENDHIGNSRNFAGGLALSLSVLCRYQTLPSAVIIALYTLFVLGKNKYSCSFLLGGIIIIPFTLFYHYNVFGSPFRTGPLVWLNFKNPFFKTAFSLIFNPSKGVLIHSPWIGVGIVGLIISLIKDHTPFLKKNISILCVLSAIPVFLLYSKLNGWYGGWCWGYRYLTDILPEMAIIATFGIHRIWRIPVLRLLAFMALIVSFFIQGVGSLAFDYEWHKVHVYGGAQDETWLWQIPHSQVIYYIRRGLVHVGKKPIKVWNSPYDKRGFSKSEVRDNREISWLQNDSSFYFVSRTRDPHLEIFLSEPVPESELLILTLWIDNKKTSITKLIPGQWNRISLNEIPFMHSGIIKIATKRDSFEPGNPDNVVAIDLKDL
ncbi:MAG TPA: hypothetical protein PLB62_08880, partial [Candidatus Sumerlaeota bacterium]|nr:hypothetical protein [Candidatus Sumerlaeota bacterium]